MTIGLLKVALHIPACNSLKEKRQVLLRLRDLLKSRFNVSFAEVGDQDKWQKMVLAIVSVATQKSRVDRCLAKIVDLIKDMDAVELLDYELEWL